MLVELSVMEQRYQAVLAVVQDGWKVVEVADRLGAPPKGSPDAVEDEYLRGGARRDAAGGNRPPRSLGAG